MKHFSRLAAFMLISVGLSAGTVSAETSGRIVPERREEVQLSFAPLVKKVAPAVVNIYTRRTVSQQASPFMNDPFFRQFFGNGGLSRQKVEGALGSGVIVDKEGLIVTNAHVIDKADEITVVLPDGRSFDATRAIADSASDVAILRIKPGNANLPYVTLKPSESLEVGDLVLAIGNPFGVGQTVTSGIVSALARSSLAISDYNFFIQTDAAINPGNSGGPLVAMDGAVVGINSAIYSRDGGSLGIGFAIPSEMVAAVLASVQAGQEGRIVRPWLGVVAQPITSDIAESLGFDVPHGLLIAKLDPASPLAAAGLRMGDIILTMNDRALRDPAEMKFRMATIPLGQTARFGAMRQGQPLNVDVKAIAPPDIPARATETLRGQHPFDGATVSNINPAVATELGLAESSGVVIARVADNALAARFFEPGLVIVAVNGAQIGNVADLKRVLAQPQGGWDMVVSSGGQKRRVILR